MRQKLLAEFIGTAALLACVVGSGIMGVNLAQGNSAIALLANAGATAGMLYVLIQLLGPVSGAHFNPVVTWVMWRRNEISGADALAYVFVQVFAAVAGVLIAHAMFELPLLQPGTRARTGGAQWLSEALATFGLVLTILLGLRHKPARIPALVAAYIFAAYWFTASTSFANPAVSLARALTQTFAGIRGVDTPAFMIAQFVGAALAMQVDTLLLSPSEKALTPDGS